MRRRAKEDDSGMEMENVMAMRASEIKDCLAKMNIGTNGVYEVMGAHALFGYIHLIIKHVMSTVD